MIQAGPGGNELFPSADWRCLLPDPAPASVVALGDGPLPALARSLGPDPGPGGSGAGLGVADRADDATLTRLTTLVRPGGTMYLEVPWPRRRSSRPLVRRVLEAGFRDPIVYSLSPSDDRWSASWWIPIGDPAAVRLVASARGRSVGRGRSMVDRLRSAVCRLVARRPSLIAAHPWLLHPTRRQTLCVVALRRDEAGGGRTSARPGLLVHSIGGETVGMRSAAMRVGGSATDQAMLFGFDGDGPVPRIVVKAPTDPEEVAASGHEATILARLAAGPEPVPRVPRPVRLEAGSLLPAWGQTFVPGDSVAAVVDPTDLAALGPAMTAWLCELADRTAVWPEPGCLPRLASEALARSGPLWSALADGAELQDRARRRIDAIGPGPLVCQHRDLGPWNTVVDGGSMGVIDWADAVPAGPPLCDLLHFLTHLVLCANDAYGVDRRAALIAQLSDPRTMIGGLVDRELRCYAGAVGLESDSLPGLRVLTWLLDLGRRPATEQPGSIYLELLRAEFDAPVGQRR